MSSPYLDRTITELRSIACKIKASPPTAAQPGLWRATATKEQLAEAIITTPGHPLEEQASQPAIFPARQATLDEADPVTPAAHAIVAPQAAPTPKIPIAPTNDLASAIQESIASAITGTLSAASQLDPAQVNKLIDKRLAQLPTQISITTPAKPTPSTPTICHYLMPRILSRLAQRINVMLVGPAGSGKTHVAHACAEALQLPYYGPNVGPQTSLAQIMGYMDATGKFVPGWLYKPYTQGGVLLVDEIDAANPGVLTSINQAISNGSCYFPNGEQAQRHADFVMVAAANTHGNGADRIYVGRSQIDGATLDRFCNINFGYDLALEKALTPQHWHDWVNYVVAIRDQAAELKLRHIVSPRASINGATVLETGADLDDVLEEFITKGLSKTDITRLTDASQVRIARDHLKAAIKTNRQTRKQAA